MVLPVGAPNNLLSQRQTAQRQKVTSTAQGDRTCGTPVLPAPLVVQHVAQNQHVEVQLGLAPTGGGGFFASVRFSDFMRLRRLNRHLKSPDPSPGLIMHSRDRLFIYLLFIRRGM